MHHHVIGFTREWFRTSDPLWWILFGSRFIIYGCLIAFFLFALLFSIGNELAKWYKNEPWLFSVKSKGNPELKRDLEYYVGKELARWYKNKDPWFFDAPVKSKGNPELKRNYQDSLLWVTTASHPLAAPLKSKMTWLKGPKLDQLPNLFNTPKSVGTLEELLIMP